jgi:anti-sigma B factor antagonist
MELDLTKRQKDGIWILNLRGRLVMGESEAMLRREIVTLTGGGAVRLVINLAEVSEIDADGLGTLVSCYARFPRHNGALKLLNPNPSHLNLMVAAKLVTVFEVFWDEQDAVNSFFPDRAVQSYDILGWIQNWDMHRTPDSSK